MSIKQRKNIPVINYSLKIIIYLYDIPFLYISQYYYKTCGNTKVAYTFVELPVLPLCKKSYIITVIFINKYEEVSIFYIDA